MAFIGTSKKVKNVLPLPLLRKKIYKHRIICPFEIEGMVVYWPAGVVQQYGSHAVGKHDDGPVHVGSPETQIVMDGTFGTH